MANAMSYDLPKEDRIHVRIAGLTHIDNDVFSIDGITGVGELPMEEMAKLLVDHGFDDLDARHLAERFMHEAWAHQLAKVLAERITPIY
jgi:hypothetical protein